MGVIKNNVGRPSNKTKLTRLILKGILVFILSFCVGYTASSLFLRFNKNEESNVKKESIIENAVDAEKLLVETFGQGYSGLGLSSINGEVYEIGSKHYKINYNDNKVKTLAALHLTKSSEEKVDICKYFNCKKSEEIEDCYSIDDSGVLYFRDIDIYDIKDVEKLFKTKFKNGKVVKENLSKEDSDYFYKEEKYYNLYHIHEGGDIIGHPLNEVYRNYKKGNELYIEMVTSPIKYDSDKGVTYLLAKDNSKIEYDFNDSTDFINFVKEHGSKLRNYTLKFELRNGKYIFVEQDKEISV